MCGNNPFRVEAIVVVLSQGCRCAPTAGLKLANAFGVFFQTEPAAENGALIRQSCRILQILSSVGNTSV